MREHTMIYISKAFKTKAIEFQMQRNATGTQYQYFDFSFKIDTKRSDHAGVYFHLDVYFGFIDISFYSTSHAADDTDNNALS